MERGLKRKFNHVEADAGGSGQEMRDGGLLIEQMVTNKDKVRSGTQALLNKVVLEKLSRKLSAQDMLGIRGTCSAWNKKFLPEIKQRHQPIELNANTNNLGQNGASSSNGNRKRRLKDFTDCLGRSQDIPFTKYCLWNADPETWLDFFSVCGMPVKDLTLECNGTGSGKIKVNWVKLLFQLAPQLEKLLLEYSLLKSPIESAGGELQLNAELTKLKKLLLYDSAVPQQMLNELVRCSVNLEQLDVVSHENLSAPAALRNFSQNLVKLRTLKIYPLHPDDLRILVDLGTRKENPLGLTKFVGETQDDFPEEEATLLTTFLVAQASCLRTLSLNLSLDESSQPNFRIPKMCKLAKLKLNYLGDAEDEYKLFYEGGTLTTALPALKSFTWESDYRLKELQLNSHDGVTHLNLPENLAKHCLGMNFKYPALTHLHINMNYANVEEFVQLWSKWPNLKSIHVKYLALVAKPEQNPTPNLDELLTGLPTAALNDLKADLGFQNDWASLVVNLGRIRQLMDKYKTRAGISDLPQLSEFTLELISDCDYELTDIGGYFGFAMASSALQHISIRQSTNTQVRITPNCEGVIREALGPYAFIT